MIFIMFKQFRLIPRTSLSCGVYGILNYIIKTFKLSKFNGCYLIKLVNLKISINNYLILRLPIILSLFNVLSSSYFVLNELFKVIIGFILIYVLFYLLTLLGIVTLMLDSSGLIEFDLYNMINSSYHIEPLLPYEYESNWKTPPNSCLNWKIPNNEYLYSNFNNMELDQIHKYYINLEFYNNLPKDDGIIKKDFIRHQILKDLYYTCTINDTRPHVRFAGKTVYEIIPENYYYGSDSDSETEYPYIPSNTTKNK